MKIKYLIIVWCLSLFPTNVLSGSYSVEFILEQVKQKQLPEICAHMGALHAGRTPKGKQLRIQYGPDWDHMHHFSWALVDQQKGLYGEAIGNLDYVLRNCKKDFKLRPMVLLQKASILKINNQFLEAIPVYRELIEIKPDSEEGWIGMANLFLLLGDQNSARMTAQKGLTHLPNSGKLKAFLR